MDLTHAVRELNTAIKKHQPDHISSSWILQYTPRVYRYVQKYVRTETNDIDWDAVTSLLEKRYQKRWIRYRYVAVKAYENKDEVDIILTKHREKLYTFITCLDEKDYIHRNRIIIALVRLSQKGNTTAQDELIKLINYVVDDWIEKYYYLTKWKGYSDDLEDQIKGCIRRYRYTGSFLGYLYKTLEYAGRGIVPIQKYSLDDPVLDGKKTKIDYIDGGISM